MKPDFFNPKTGEIWLAYLRYRDIKKNAGRVRPVLIIKVVTPDTFTVFKITSHGDDSRYDFVSLNDWEKEGLKEPSRVQLYPAYDVAREDFRRITPLGKVSLNDLEAIVESLEDVTITKVTELNREALQAMRLALLPYDEPIGKTLGGSANTPQPYQSPTHHPSPQQSPDSPSLGL